MNSLKNAEAKIQMKHATCDLPTNVNNHITSILGGEKRKGEKRGWWTAVTGLSYYTKTVDTIHIPVYVNSASWSHAMLWCWCINPRSIRVRLRPEEKRPRLKKKSLKLVHEQLSCLNTSVSSKVGTTLESHTIRSSFLHTFSISRFTCITHPRRPQGSVDDSRSTSCAILRVSFSGTRTLEQPSLVCFDLDRQFSSILTKFWQVVSSNITSLRLGSGTT